jgi:anti-anti-sigma regulatory factor
VPPARLEQLGDPAGGDSPIVLPADFDLRCAVGMQARFVEALGGKVITLDGSQVQRADTAGVQLLCALVIAAERSGRAITWTAVSPALVTVVQLLGLHPIVQLEGVKQEGLEWFE